MRTVIGGRDTRDRRILAGVYNDLNGQPECSGEVEVALIVRGHGHDRAGAVVGQHIVRCPHLDAFTVDRVDRVALQEHAGLVTGVVESIDLGRLLDLVEVSGELCFG